MNIAPIAESAQEPQAQTNPQLNPQNHQFPPQTQSEGLDSAQKAATRTQALSACNLPPEYAHYYDDSELEAVLAAHHGLNPHRLACLDQALVCQQLQELGGFLTAHNAYARYLEQRLHGAHSVIEVDYFAKLGDKQKLEQELAGRKPLTGLSAIGLANDHSQNWQVRKIYLNTDGKAQAIVDEFPEAGSAAHSHLVCEHCYGEDQLTPQLCPDALVTTVGHHGLGQKHHAHLIVHFALDAQQNGGVIKPPQVLNHHIAAELKLRTLNHLAYATENQQFSSGQYLSQLLDGEGIAPAKAPAKAARTKANAAPAEVYSEAVATQESADNGTNLADNSGTSKLIPFADNPENYAPTRHAGTYQAPTDPYHIRGHHVMSSRLHYLPADASEESSVSPESTQSTENLGDKEKKSLSVPQGLQPPAKLIPSPKLHSASLQRLNSTIAVTKSVTKNVSDSYKRSKASLKRASQALHNRMPAIASMLSGNAPASTVTASTLAEQRHQNLSNRRENFIAKLEAKSELAKQALERGELNQQVNSGLVNSGLVNSTQVQSRQQTQASAVDPAANAQAPTTANHSALVPAARARPDYDYLTPNQKRLARQLPARSMLIAILVCLTIIPGFTNTGMGPAVYEIKTEFSTSVVALQAWYLFGMALGQLTWGPWFDRWGRRPAVVLLAILGILVNIVMINISAYQALFALRWAQGFVYGGLAILPAIILKDIFSTRNFVLYNSWVILFFLLAPAIGPLWSGQIITWFGSWRYIFVILTSATFFVLVAFIWFFPETIAKKDKRVWKPGQNLRAYGKILKNRRAQYLIALNVGYSITIFAMPVLTPNLYIYVYGIKENYFGLYLLMPICFTLLGNRINASLVRRHYSPRKVWIRASMLQALFTLVNIIVSYFFLGPIGIMLAFTANLFFNGFQLGNIQALYLQLFPEQTATANSLLAFFRTGVASVLVFMIGLLPHYGGATLLHFDAAIIILCACLTVWYARNFKAFVSHQQDAIDAAQEQAAQEQAAQEQAAQEQAAQEKAQQEKAQQEKAQQPTTQQACETLQANSSQPASQIQTTQTSPAQTISPERKQAEQDLLATVLANARAVHKRRQIAAKVASAPESASSTQATAQAKQPASPKLAVRLQSLQQRLQERLQQHEQARTAMQAAASVKQSALSALRAASSAFFEHEQSEQERLASLAAQAAREQAQKAQQEALEKQAALAQALEKQALEKQD